MKFRIALILDSDNYYVDQNDALEVETTGDDFVQLTLERPSRTVKIKKSELRYALAFCGDVEDH